MKEGFIETLSTKALNELIDLREFFKQTLSENISTITELQLESSSDFINSFIDNFSNYHFRVGALQFDKQKNELSYFVSHIPRNPDNLAVDTRRLLVRNVKGAFIYWIESCKTLNHAKHKYLNPTEAFYDEEFKDFFTNNDTDADINPFELERQEFAYYFLKDAIHQISVSEKLSEENKERLINQATELQEQIPFYTKRKLMHSFSKLAQQTKQASNRLFHEIFDVLKKEAIKGIFYKGMDSLPHAIDSVQHWISIIVHNSH